MKIKNLLVMSAVLACGLTLASCDQPKPSTSNGGETATEVTVGICKALQGDSEYSWFLG